MHGGMGDLVLRTIHADADSPRRLVSVCGGGGTSANSRGNPHNRYTFLRFGVCRQLRRVSSNFVDTHFWP
ncbi:hypothetical protein RISK_003297 [Rhodopirellula islandica]|uniref:Uncharacterized protein n=1 Tax=Rhodopirellula islandica TaxID=595434 RepID=A0A0J1BDR0_RHOIS|nr:hypothetical protein RISK_003297 [Rhodopirellula islandica]